MTTVGFHRKSLINLKCGEIRAQFKFAVCHINLKNGSSPYLQNHEGSKVGRKTLKGSFLQYPIYLCRRNLSTGIKAVSLKANQL